MRSSAMMRTTTTLLSLLVLLLLVGEFGVTPPRGASQDAVATVTRSGAFDAEQACEHEGWAQRQASGFAKAAVR
jgi:hypothetical protein